jgi:RNA polymerase sigma-70 factor (ECF subfamily)|nr:RNA polymerase sigma factor [Kofleriaceae bacterium]
MAVPQPDVTPVIALGAAERVADADLVRRAIANDTWAIEAIYRRYVRLVANVAQRLLRSDAEVDDVVQETFMIAYQQLPRLAEPAALKGWLARIAVSRVHRRFRWSRFTRLFTGAELEASLHDQATDAASPEQRAELALIDRALARMSLKVRTPWVLRHVVGYQLEDIAVACECSLATVKRRIAEAEAIVKDHLGDEAAR